MADELLARRVRRIRDTAAGVPIAALLESFELSLTGRELSPRTVEVYQRTGSQLIAFLAARGYPSDSDGITPEHLREFLATEVQRTSALSAHQHYRNLRVIFRWMVREGERQPPSPMDRVDPPRTTEKVKPILGTDQLQVLLNGCEGQGFEARRDKAILRILIDTGVRVSGLANVKLTDVSLGRRQVRVVLKGGDEHLIPLGRKSAADLDRYLRARARHAHADSDWLWLGLGGRKPSHFGSAGIQDMLSRRGRAAGIPALTPHWFRRTAAHLLLDSGMQEMDVARVAGWKSTDMVRRYAGELAAERARTAHARLSPGDRLD